MPISAIAQAAPGIEWQRCLGGTDVDQAYGIIQNTNGNYVVIGSTSSIDGDVVNTVGGDEMWVVELDQTGEIVWQKTYGGSGWDGGYSICQATDGGYLALGVTGSNDGDVFGNHGGDDIWVVKLNSTGTIEWQRTVGGSSYESAIGLNTTIDGGYLIAGRTTSTDGDATENFGGMDAWVIKLGSDGAIQWQRTLGGTGTEVLGSIIQTTDGSYVALGFTSSNDGHVSGNHGMNDMWVVKLNAQGEFVWQNSLGSSLIDGGRGIEETPDGGFIVSGAVGFSDGNVSGFNGGSNDVWLVKLNDNGQFEWQQCYGGSNEDGGMVNQTPDGGYAMLCVSSSSDGDVSGNNGSRDFWLLGLDQFGELLWQTNAGGGLSDDPWDLCLTADGGFAAVGYTSSNDNDVSGNHGGLHDIWVVKWNSNPTYIDERSSAMEMSIFPNPTIGDNLLMYSLETAAHVQVELLDATGKLLSILSSTEQNAGEYSTSIPLNGFPAGSYMVTLKVNGHVTLRQVVRV